MDVILENIANIQVGYQSRTKISEQHDSKYRLIQGKDFNQYNELVVESLMRVLPERKTANYIVKNGDILFQARGTNHYSYCLSEELSNTLVSGSFYIIRTKSERVLPQYLCWWLNQSPAQTYFQSEAGATIISYISVSVLSNIKIPLPTISTQQKIVKLTDLMKMEQKQLNTLGELRQQLVQSVCKNAIKSEGEDK